jgi:hypothetical protein
MSFLRYNLAAVENCNGIVLESDVPDYRAVVMDCNKKFGEDFVSVAAGKGIAEFKESLKEGDKDALCHSVKRTLRD